MYAIIRIYIYTYYTYIYIYTYYTYIYIYIYILYVYIYIHICTLCCVSNGKMKCGSALLAFWTSVLSRCLEPILCHGDPFWTLGGVVGFWYGALFRSCSCCCNCWRGQGVACLINAVIISAMFVVTLGVAIVLILLLVQLYSSRLFYVYLYM